MLMNLVKYPLQELAANFRAFISGKSRTHLRLSLPCGAHSLDYFFCLVSAKFMEIPRNVQLSKRMRHHYARAVGSGIDFLFVLASRMLLPVNLGFLSCGVQNRNLACNLCCCCFCSDFSSILVGIPE